MGEVMDSVPSQHLTDICSAIVKASYTEKIQVLDAVDLGERFKKALPLLMRQIEVSICVYVCVCGGGMGEVMDSVPSQHLTDICSAIVKASYTEKIQVLDAVDLGERFKKALPLLMRQIEVSICVYVCVCGGGGGGGDGGGDGQCSKPTSNRHLFSHSKGLIYREDPGP